MVSVCFTFQRPTVFHFSKLQIAFIPTQIVIRGNHSLDLSHDSNIDCFKTSNFSNPKLQICTFSLQHFDIEDWTSPIAWFKVLTRRRSRRPLLPLLDISIDQSECLETTETLDQFGSSFSCETPPSSCPRHPVAVRDRRCCIANGAWPNAAAGFTFPFHS